MTPRSLERGDLRLRKRAGLAFEGDFLGLVPIDVGPQAIDQRRELLAAEERRRAAAEIDEAERPASHHRQAADQFDLARQGRDIGLDVRGVLVGVDAEVAELAALAAERNVQVQPQRHFGRRRMQGLVHVGQRLGRPLRKRRIVGDEIAANFGLGGFCGH